MELNYEKEKRIGLTPQLNHLIKTIPDANILSPEEIAGYIGMSVRQVRRYCEQGIIKSYCFGRKYIVYGNDFKEFMSNSQVRSASAREVLYE
ncbi:helix-turn-helix domain-containing protein [Peribacillus frigoritolerans]|uniref:helix-turn-helix domain-containing protein n=1 Tax=Peribacillus frigoritolerans TaxID=450367 RepID=UPI0039A281A3